MFKLGIIGCGRIVEEGHSKAFKALTDEVEVVAISDPSPERLKVIGDILGVKEGGRFQDYKEMLGKVKIDFVDIAVPHFLHEKVVIDCAAAGLNIINEKPLATNLEEADRMLAAVEKNKVKLCIIHNYKYHPHYKKAIELIKDGAIGKPFFIRSEGLGGGHYPGAKGYDPDWRTKSTRSGGGCLLDNGYHNIYLVREMMGSPIKSVYATAGTYVQPIDVDDLAVATFKHENGGTSIVMVSWAVKAGGIRANEVHGTEGSISFDKPDRPLALYRNKRGEWEYPDLGPKTDFNVSFVGIMRDCFQAVRKGGPLPTDGKEGRKNLEIIMAAYKSAKTGEVVEI
jgi:predicted dehydrogenase